MVDLTATQYLRTNLTLDLNGYSIGDTLTGTSLLSLSADSLYLHIFSSRTGGRIWCTRTYDGCIYAVPCYKGQLTLDHVQIEVSNTSDTLLNASSCGFFVGKTATLHMSDCSVRSSVRIYAYGVNTYEATIQRCEMEVKADSTNAYSVYIYKDTTSVETKEAYVEQTVLRVSATQKAFGLLTQGTVIMRNDSHALTTLRKVVLRDRLCVSCVSMCPSLTDNH